MRPACAPLGHSVPERHELVQSERFGPCFKAPTYRRHEALIRTPCTAPCHVPQAKQYDVQMKQVKERELERYGDACGRLMVDKDDVRASTALTYFSYSPFIVRRFVYRIYTVSYISYTYRRIALPSFRPAKIFV
jgi:hypothetical protein